MEDVKVSEYKSGPYDVRLTQERDGTGQRILIQVSRPNPNYKKSTWEQFLSALGVHIN